MASRGVSAAGALAIAIAAGTACGHDAAEREYLAALRGEEAGMSREQQIAHVDRAIQLAPTRPYYYETRAIYRIDLRDYARAHADISRAIELADRPYARFLRGLVTCEGGAFAASLPDFDLAIARQPGNTQFYRGRSLARAAVGDASGALQDADRLVARAPQMGESHYARGVALTKLGRDQEAIPEFDRAAAIRPELIYVLEARADAYERLGDSSRAAGDRRAAGAARAERPSCALCVDPFRY